MLSRRKLQVGLTVFALLLFASTPAVLRPGWVVTILAKWSPEVVYFVETQEPAVALTIDDGPDPVVTSKILDVLRQHGARATFFLVTERIPGNEKTVARIVEEGHELGNHLMSDGPSIKVSPQEFERQLMVAHDTLSRYSDVGWFRPGSGRYNTAMLSILRKNDYRCALGSVYPFDARVRSSWFSAQYVLWNVQSGSVIVLHDYGAQGERTVSVLATILPELNRRGLRVVSLSELVALQPRDQ